MSLAWFREGHPEAPQELEACFQAKFYVDDVALRLYAAAEYLASFIIAFLNISDAELENYREKHTSLASTVGNYLITEKPNHDITLIVKKLIDEKDWGRVMGYRNIWVHKQPPLIEGMGIVYERKSRWTKTEKGYFLGIGGGDEPQYTVDSLLHMVSSATHAFVEVLSELSIILLDELKSLGIEIEADSGKVNIKIL